MMSECATIEFHEGPYRFSAGHFTIFSATERERLHGHNYSLAASITAGMSEPGLTFNYKLFKDKLRELCKHLDRRFLLPQHSPYLTLEEDSDYYFVTFNQEKIPFLKSDVLLLPVANTTLEDLSQWVINQVISDEVFIQRYAISAVTIKVFNGPEQSAKRCWVGE